MQEVYRLMACVAADEVTTILCGPTGTGKGLIARAIHNHSRRACLPFLHQNCAALPRELLESELFGHCRGSFTGAGVDRKGLFEAAEGGAVFLDEIGEATPAVQVRLLHVLEEGVVKRVGENHTRSVDVRVIAATNRDLEAEVKAGRFREDLYYRLQVFPVRVPTLKERSEDIPLLAQHFLARNPSDKLLQGFEPEVIEAFLCYDWPGNVRELRNEIHRCVVLTDPGEKIGLRYLPYKISRRRVEENALLSAQQAADRGQLLKLAREEFERQFIVNALKEQGWNVTHTAAGLGMSRVGLQVKMRKYHIRRQSMPGKGERAVSRPLLKRRT